MDPGYVHAHTRYEILRLKRMNSIQRNVRSSIMHSDEHRNVSTGSLYATRQESKEQVFAARIAVAAGLLHYNDDGMDESLR